MSYGADIQNGVPIGLPSIVSLGLPPLINPYPALNLDFVNNQTLDPRITFTRASSATYFDQNGVLQTASNDVARFDHDPATLQPLGLLIEEQRTNSIRNNTMQGAVAGTPGTVPTNWAVSSTANGITREIVGVGVENGVTYLDLKYSGTPTATATFAVVSEATNSVVAATGQTWTGSVFVRLVGGSLTNVTVNNSVFGRSVVGAALESTQTTITPTNAALNTQRFVTVRTLTDASTERVTQQIVIVYTNGAAIDITLRIGLPQLEQGAFATSVIPTTSASATRNADVASMTGTNFSDWYNAAEGTLYAESLCIQPSSVFINVAGVFTPSNQIVLQLGRNGADSRGFGQAASINQGSGTFPANSFVKQILAGKVNDFALSTNGSAVATDTSTDPMLPTSNFFGIGIGPTGGSIFNGTIRKLAYYPTRLSNEQLQALTG